MGCRCADIARCKGELDMLNGAVAAGLQAAEGHSAQATQALQNAAKSVGESVAAPAMNALQTRLAALHTRAHQLLPGLQSRCGTETQRLQALLAALQSEDSAHHAARAAAKAAAAAAASQNR